MQRIFITAFLAAVALMTARGNETTTDTLMSTLPELNVVALKQGDQLENQPVSATVIGSSEILLDNITDIKNLSDLVPNFYMPAYGSRITSTIYVRGIGARMDQPSVGLNIDNMPVMNKDAYDLDIPDISHIEMLRGPQSSLYGRNTIGGLVNIRTLSPLNWQGLRLMGEALLTGGFHIQGGWYHLFKKNIGFSASVALNSVKGRHHNVYNNSEVGSEKSGSVRIKAEWLAKPDLSLTNTFSTSLLRQTGYAYEYVGTKEINYNDTCYYKRFLLNDVITLKALFPEWTLSSITSVQHINDDMTLDQDFLPLPYFTLTQKKQATDLTEELMARRAGTHDYNWLAGLFAFYRHLDMQAPVTFKDTGIYKLIESHRNEANPYYPIKWYGREFGLNSDFTLPSFGLALYHESRYQTGRWKFSAGLRLDYERIMLRYRSFTDTGYTIYYNPSGNLSTPMQQWELYKDVDLFIDDTGRLSMHFLTLLPKASVLYELPTLAGNVYATVGKGYKAGGYNTQMFSDVLQQRLMTMMGIGSKYDVEDIVKYKPEYSWNYEIGAHLELLPLTLNKWLDIRADLSLFYIDCRDLQLTMFPEGTTTGRIMTNAGKMRSTGGELSVWWMPSESFSLNLSYGHTSAVFRKFNDGKNDYRGKTVPYAPQNTIYAQAIYTLSGNRLGNKSVIFDVNMRAVGKIYWNEQNTLSQPLYALLGASVTFKAPKWEIQAWGRNLSCTKYDTFYFMSMGNEFLQRGEKISCGVLLRLFI